MNNTETIWTILGVLIPIQAVTFGVLSHQISTMGQQLLDLRVDLARIEQKLDDHINDDRAHVHE